MKPVPSDPLPRIATTDGAARAAMSAGVSARGAGGAGGAVGAGAGGATKDTGTAGATANDSGAHPAIARLAVASSDAKRGARLRRARAQRGDRRFMGIPRGWVVALLQAARVPAAEKGAEGR